MISDNMQQLINDQYHREVFSVYQYLAISSYFLDSDLDGFANFFRIQAEEESQHAMKQFDYLHEVDGKINHQAIGAADNSFDSILDAFEKALGHEQYITKHIHEIVKAALAENDFPTYDFFQWFVREQVEEESLMRTMIAKLKMIADDKSALYMMNEELLQRKAEEE
ncbi:MAG: ferritin [Bacteroidota bacterium]